MDEFGWIALNNALWASLNLTAELKNKLFNAELRVNVIKQSTWGFCDRLCGLVVRVSGYRSRDSGFNSGASRFSEKQWVWNGVHSASWGQLRSNLEEIVATPVEKTETTTGGIRCVDHATPSIRKSWHYFAKMRRSLGRHSSLADQSHGGFLFRVLWNLPNLRQDMNVGGRVFKDIRMLKYLRALVTEKKWI
jgi:hypothetical protein